MPKYPDIPYILIASAVAEEIAGLRQNIKNPVIESIGGREVVSGYIKDRAVNLLVTGPGIVNTVQGLTASIERHRPYLIIQTGCGGAFRESGMRIGDVGIAAEEIDVQLGIEAGAEGCPPDELPFPLMIRRGVDIRNRYPLESHLVDGAFRILQETLGKKGVGVQKGPFITVSTITATDRRAEMLYRHFAPCMEGMEGSGAAHLALHYDIPFLEIRAASNFVGKREREKWNLPLAFERCPAAVLELVGCKNLPVLFGT